MGMGMVRKCGWGFLEGRKGKGKMERKMERKKIGDAIKSDGDGYGKNKLVEEKMGIGVE